ncbi:LacI family DNA-binding transcriptional regulator [Sphingobacterium sp. N143]|uniref:LacI family DNA-binding transcriptional regulator n=1 Tax=Sphingobacterium sp. N143 TaxID=2746727 RepID=UPI0025776318|nr:LacI family DNA-binding transcriptional regulator [Sphingobacterium sp. N143]MDM1293910.1 LacI family DNA-binding transcriptional regulator [Sphingobacterium sp. N143]
MKFENYTIKDIAKALNLSTSTISRALRDSYEISPETKKVVLEYAEKINYRANPIARSLKERRSHSIGIIVSEIANNFFSQVINGVESIAYDKDFQIIISQTHESSERERLNVEYMTSRSIDGLLIALSSETEDISYLHKLKDRGFPIVFFDRIPQQFDTYKVIVNNQQGAYDATQHLIKQGKHRIAHLTSSKSLSITKDRLDGYKKALMANHIEFDPRLVKYCQYGGLHLDEIQKSIEELVQVDFDAIFISGDKLTTGYLHIVQGSNFKLQEVAIAGFTNSNVVDLFTSKVTAIRQPAFEMGKIATELLIKLIEAKHPITEFETQILPTELIKND